MMNVGFNILAISFLRIETYPIIDLFGALIRATVAHKLLTFTQAQMQCLRFNQQFNENNYSYFNQFFEYRSSTC